MLGFSTHQTIGHKKSLKETQGDAVASQEPNTGCRGAGQNHCRFLTICCAVNLSNKSGGNRSCLRDILLNAHKRSLMPADQLHTVVRTVAWTTTASSTEVIRQNPGRLAIRLS